MKILVYAVFGILGITTPIMAAPSNLDMEAVNSAELHAKDEKQNRPVLIKAQILLDRARFSPGVIDGRYGENMQGALEAFEKEHGLEANGVLDDEVWAKLNEVTPEAVLVEYTIQDEDVKGPFTEIPDEMKEQAKLDRLNYSSPEELLAEKFHMDQDLLKALNPGKSFDKAGTSIIVANVETQPPPAELAQKVAKVEVVKSERLLRVMGEDGQVIAAYPASVGSEEKPAPTGSHEVRAVASNPTYTYNPDYAFTGVEAKEKFEIKPGPNNPVGSTWIDLSIESYGIHGTPEPEKVGKAYSHGCVRLTNWDAEELSKMVRKETPVIFTE